MLKVNASIGLNFGNMKRFRWQLKSMIN
jgi:hypothetical protein